MTCVHSLVRIEPAITVSNERVSRVNHLHGDSKYLGPIHIRTLIGHNFVVKPTIY